MLLHSALTVRLQAAGVTMSSRFGGRNSPSLVQVHAGLVMLLACLAKARSMLTTLCVLATGPQHPAHTAVPAAWDGAWS